MQLTISEVYEPRWVIPQSLLTLFWPTPTSLLIRGLSSVVHDRNLKPILVSPDAKEVYEPRVSFSCHC